MTKVFAVPVTIHATAYIRAESADAALDMTTAELFQVALVLPDSVATVEGPPVSGLAFDDPRLPKVSLSPAMTLAGVPDGAEPERVD